MFYRINFSRNVSFVLFVFFAAANVSAQEASIKDKLSAAKEATVRKCIELREMAKEAYNKVLNAAETKYQEIDRWVNERGGWEKLSGQTLQDVRKQLGVVAKESIEKTREVTDGILAKAQKDALELGPAALLAVGTPPQSENLDFRLNDSGWSGKWVGYWDDATTSTMQWFHLIINVNKDCSVSGVMKDADGSLANVSGSIKWVECTLKDQFGFPTGDGKFWEIQLLKKYPESGVEVRWSAQLSQDRKSYRFPEIIKGTWCRVEKVDAGIVPDMGVWRMWPVK